MLIIELLLKLSIALTQTLLFTSSTKLELILENISSSAFMQDFRNLKV